jgi:hypothetical protein
VTRLLPLILVGLLAAGVAGGAVVVRGTAAGAGAPKTVRISDVTVDDQKIHLVNSLEGHPIFDIEGIAPGQEGDGTVTIGNTGSLASDLRLVTARIDDTAGPNGGELSDVLDLTVLDVTDPAAPRTVYQGDFREGQDVDAGSLAPGAQRRFKFVVEFPDGGAPASLTTGDNAYMNSQMQVDFTWTANGDEVPVQVAAPQRAPSQTIDIPLGAPSRSSRTCLSRRDFTIRVHAPRHDHLRSALVKVNGHKVKVRRRGTRLVAIVDLRRLPRTLVRVRIVARTTRGRRISEVRTYRTCLPKSPGARQ